MPRTRPNLLFVCIENSNCSQVARALATVVDMLGEVPVMLSVSSCCNRTRHWFPAPSMLSSVAVTSKGAGS